MTFSSEYSNEKHPKKHSPPNISASSVLANRIPTGTLYRENEPLLKLFIASTWIARLKGLFAYPDIKPNQALAISPCASVHTFGMRSAIDVVFIDREGVVLKVRTLQPWSCVACKGAHSVIEMAENLALHLMIFEGGHLFIKEL